MLQVLGSAEVRDTQTAVAAVTQLPHILRNVSGRSRKAAAAQHPLYESLTRAALHAVPSVDLQVCPCLAAIPFRWHIDGRVIRILPGRCKGMNWC